MVGMMSSFRVWQAFNRTGKELKHFSGGRFIIHNFLLLIEPERN